MNEGKEDYRRYNVLSTRYHVLSTKYNVPSIRDGIRDSGALRISTSSFSIGRSIFDISKNVVYRISYFLLDTCLPAAGGYFVFLLIKKALRISKGFNNVAATYSPGCNPSTIGAAGLNFSVRDGKRWDPCARPPKL